MSGVRDWLVLVRLPNLFSAAADVLGGFFFACGAAGGEVSEAWWRAGVLAGASVLLYAGGVVLNDVCDAKRDAEERPERPIPARRVSRREAGVVAAVLLAAGLVAGGAALGAAWWVAAVLTGLIISYDVLMKRTVAGPVWMGGCRALNLWMGMAASGAGVNSVVSVPVLGWAVAGYGVYVAGLTVVGWEEARRARWAPLVVGVMVMDAGMVLLAVAGWRGTLGAMWVAATVAVVVMVLHFRLRVALASGEPGAVRGIVRAGILGMVPLVAGLAAAGGGVVAGAGVLALVVPAVAAARWVSPT